MINNEAEEIMNDKMEEMFNEIGTCKVKKNKYGVFELIGCDSQCIEKILNYGGNVLWLQE